MARLNISEMMWPGGTNGGQPRFVIIAAAFGGAVGSGIMSAIGFDPGLIMAIVKVISAIVAAGHLGVGAKTAVGCQEPSPVDDGVVGIRRVQKTAHLLVRVSGVQAVHVVGGLVAPGQD